jgi:hypothetical protein
MGKLKALKELLGLVRKNEDKIAKKVSQKSSKIDEEQVKKAVDKASSAAGERKDADKN